MFHLKSSLSHKKLHKKLFLSLQHGGSTIIRGLDYPCNLELGSWIRMMNRTMNGWMTLAKRYVYTPISRAVRTKLFSVGFPLAKHIFVYSHLFYCMENKLHRASTSSLTLQQMKNTF